MPTLAAKEGETGGLVANSSRSAPPGTHLPPFQRSTRPEPSASSSQRYAPPSIFAVERIFSELGNMVLPAFNIGIRPQNFSRLYQLARYTRAAGCAARNACQASIAAGRRLLEPGTRSQCRGSFRG